jgi:hypothetical protein
MAPGTGPPAGLSQTEIELLITRHKARIGEVIPGAETFVSGSTLLGSFGGHDIDLVALVEDVADAAARMRRAYPPLYEGEWREDWAAFREPGPPQVDIVLTKPGTEGHAHHIRAWDLILADESLKAEYASLKSAGMNSAQKAAFFDHVVAKLD